MGAVPAVASTMVPAAVAAPWPLRAAGRQPPPSDEALLQSAGQLLPWDASRYVTLGVLQRCPRNQGEVVLVEDLQSKRKLASKRVPVAWACLNAKEFLERNPGETEVPWMDIGVTRWLSEQGFGHAVGFEGAYLDGDHIAFVMGFAEGGDLFSHLDRLTLPGPALDSEATLRSLIVEFFGAVTQLHDLGLAHRDLSLENVLLAGPRQGPVKLIDFSMATTQRLCDGPACGKPSYIAPEVHLGCGYDAFVADSFSCGVILYALVVRDYPWMSTRPWGCKCFEFVRKHGLAAFLARRCVAAVGGEKRPVAELVSPGLASLLAGLLAFEPAARLTMQRSPSGFGSVWDHPWVKGAPAHVAPR